MMEDYVALELPFLSLKKFFSCNILDYPLSNIPLLHCLRGNIDSLLYTAEFIDSYIQDGAPKIHGPDWQTTVFGRFYSCNDW